MSIFLCPQNFSLNFQIYRLVLLRRSFPQHLRHRPPNNDPYQSLCLHNLHLLPLHATTASPSRIWIPRQRRPQQRPVRLDEGKVCKFSSRHAFHALRILVLHRLYDDLPLRHVPQDSRARRAAQIQNLVTLLRLIRNRLPVMDSHHHNRNSEPLLPRCFRGFLCRYTCLCL